jgi:hypothetical protein
MPTLYGIFGILHFIRLLFANIYKNTTSVVFIAEALALPES